MYTFTQRFLETRQGSVVCANHFLYTAKAQNIYNPCIQHEIEAAVMKAIGPCTGWAKLKGKPTIFNFLLVTMISHP